MTTIHNPRLTQVFRFLHARYADVSGAGHMVAGDRNDRFTRAVRDFLRDELGAPARGRS